MAMIQKKNFFLFLLQSSLCIYYHVFELQHHCFDRAHHALFHSSCSTSSAADCASSSSVCPSACPRAPHGSNVRTSYVAHPVRCECLFVWLPVFLSNHQLFENRSAFVSSSKTRTVSFNLALLLVVVWLTRGPWLSMSWLTGVVGFLRICRFLWFRGTLGVFYNFYWFHCKRMNKIRIGLATSSTNESFV